MLAFLVDSNCVRIMTPLEKPCIEPNSYIPGERVGNLDRLHSKILAPLMDDGTPNFTECNMYGVGFKFACRLESSTNHTYEGYQIFVVVYSTNSDVWTDSLFDFLHDSGLNPTKLN